MYADEGLQLNKQKISECFKDILPLVIYSNKLNSSPLLPPDFLHFVAVLISESN